MPRSAKLHLFSGCLLAVAAVSFVLVAVQTASALMWFVSVLLGGSVVIMAVGSLAADRSPSQRG